MNYYKKYLKYKNKYLKLKIDGGSHRSSNSSTIFLSGPVNSAYISKNDKKIILLSDIHETNDKCKVSDESQIEIQNYFKKLFNQNNGTIDFFIEYDWNLVKKNLNNLDEIKNKINDNDYLSKVIKLSLNYYKLNSNRRIHFSDIRKNALNLRKLNEPLNELINMVTLKDENDKINLIENFKDIYEKYIVILFDFYTSINKYIKKDKSIKIENKILEKEILKLEKIIGKPNMKKILELVKQKIEILLDYVFAEDTIMSLDDYSMWGFNIVIPLTYIGELYTLSRILKPEFKNIIVYEGNAHIVILYEFLEILDFKKNHFFNPVSNNCLNIIPFEVYFNLNETVIVDPDCLKKQKTYFLIKVN